MTSSPTACPPESTLRLLGGDFLGDETFAAIESHVETCAKCRDAMERIVRAEADGPADPAIPGFEIERELGRGSAGVVYLATEPGLERQVALKLVARDRPEDPGQRARWLAEARAASRLRHADIVRLYRVDETDRWFVLVFEYIPGGTLKERLGEPLDPSRAARLAETVARAVAHIHEKGLLHLDLKPSNILLDGPADGSVDETVPKISDFGIARASSDPGHTLGGRLGPWGTPSYMSPEQAEGRAGAIGPASDVHALGAVLYEMLTGRPPFRSDSVARTLDRIRREAPVPPRAVASGVPRDLEAIALRCLEKDPARRYPTAGALAVDLAAWSAGTPVSSRAGLGRRRRPAAVGILAAVFALAVWAEVRLRGDGLPDRAAWIKQLQTNVVPRDAGEHAAFRRAVVRHTRELKADPAVDVDGLAAIAVLERQHAERYVYNEDGRGVFDALLASSVELLTECLRRGGADQDLRWELVLSEMNSGNYPDAVVSLADGRLVHLERAEALVRGIERLNRRIDVLRRASDVRRLHATRFRQLGQADVAAELFAADLRSLAATGPPDSETADLAWRARLSREGAGLAPPLYASKEVLSDDGGRWIYPEDREMLIRESIASAFGEAIFRNRPLGDRPEVEAAREARERLDEIRRGCAEGGIDDRIVPRATLTAVLVQAGGGGARLRASGRHAEAVDVARRYLACCEAVTAAFPDDPDGFLTLSDAHIQTAKNAWRASDDDGAKAALLRARDAARRAAELAPQSIPAREAVEDRERRLARALGEAAGARRRP